MYTVVRFDCSGSNLSVEAVGERLQQMASIRYEGPDAGCRHRVSYTVARDDDWKDHVASMSQFLDRSAEVIDWARSCGVWVGFDVAIEPDDYLGLVGSFGVGHEFMQQLGQKGVDLVVSVYR